MNTRRRCKTPALCWPFRLKRDRRQSPQIGGSLDNLQPHGVSVILGAHLSNPGARELRVVRTNDLLCRERHSHVAAGKLLPKRVLRGCKSAMFAVVDAKPVAHA